VNKYVVFDGFRYTCPFKMWDIQPEKPMSYRYTWGAGIEVTYGPSIFKTWRGSLVARMTPVALYGSIADLRISLAKVTFVEFEDHDGVVYHAHAAYAGPEKSFSPKWDGASNAIYIPVIIVAEAA